MSGPPERIPARRAAVAALSALALALGCAPAAGPALEPAACGAWRSPSVEAWPEADRLFTADRQWAGGDGASSVALGGGRVLWLFGDTLLWNGDRTARTGADVSNSVGIQTGLDPTRAGMEFFWGERDGRPAPFFEHRAGPLHFYWPGDAELVDGRLLVVFLMGAERDPASAFGVSVADWSAVAIAQPEAPPGRWQLDWLATPANAWGIPVGSASAFVHAGHLYAFSANVLGARSAFLARWPLAEVRARDLSRPRWWTGRDWVAQQALAGAPAPVFDSAQVEFSVHYDGALRRWVALQSVGLGVESPASLGLRLAPGLTGPWSPLAEVYTPPEAAREEAWVYAGKAHPELEVAAPGLALTYVANARDVERLKGDATLYVPRFARLRWRSAEAAPLSCDGRAAAGASPGPRSDPRPPPGSSR